MPPTSAPCGLGAPPTCSAHARFRRMTRPVTVSGLETLQTNAARRIATRALAIVASVCTASLVGATASAAIAATAVACAGNAELIAACTTIRGRIALTNGAYWAHIWKVGTRRVVGIRREIPLPANLRDALGGRSDVVVFGDFVVCPFTRDVRGRMQSVCVESATRLRVEATP